MKPSVRPVPHEDMMREEWEMIAAGDMPCDNEDDDVGRMLPGYDSGGGIVPPRGSDITHLLYYPPQAHEIASAVRTAAGKAPFRKAPVSAPVEASKAPSVPFHPGAMVPRLNVASVKAHALEFGYHVRRGPWEAGSVHAPLVITGNPADGTPRPVKTLWQSNAYIDSKIVRPGPLSFRLAWPPASAAADDKNKNVVRLDRAHDPPLVPLFYTEEGYVYLPKKILWRDDRVAVLKYVEFWGWNWEPTRSPPREVSYTAHLKAGIHALGRYATANAAAAPDGDSGGVGKKGKDRKEEGKPREDLGVHWARAFREEVKTRELLGLTGSAHFTRLVGFPAHSDSGFFAECDEWQRAGRESLDRLLAKTGKWSVYSVWKMFECLAKACAVMAWGSEYPDFPVEGWNQIVHLGLGQPSLEISMAPDPGHTCGGDICFKISDFTDAIRWPAGDVVNNPWEDVDKPGANKFRAIEARSAQALKEHHYKLDSNYAPEVAQALAEDGDSNIVPDIRGNYGWWTNVWAIGDIVGGIYRHSQPPIKKPRSKSVSFQDNDNVVPDPALGVTDPASLAALTHREQEAYWRRHAGSRGSSSNSAARLERLVAACTAERPRDRITIPDLLLEITKGLSEADKSRRDQPPPPLHWEEDGQRMLIARCHDRIRKLASSNLYSRRELGLRLHSAVCEEMQALARGRDGPSPEELPMGGAQERFNIRVEDRQKWDEVVRKLFVEQGRPAAERLRWEIGTREVSVDGSEDDSDKAMQSDHDIDCVYGTQVTEHDKLERFPGRLARWDISWYTG